MQYLERNFFIISYFGFGFTSAYNSIPFCCFRRNVKPCCHTHDSLSTVIVYSASVLGRSRAVEPRRRWLVIARGAWRSNTRIPAINEKPAACAIYKPRCTSYWSQSQILVENRDFSLPHLHSRPPLEGFPSEYCHAVWYGKTRMVALVGLTDGEKNWWYSFWHNSRTWQSDKAPGQLRDNPGQLCCAGWAKTI